MNKTLADTLTANLKSAKTPEARAAWEAANLPPDLAALRAAQRAAAQTNEVTVTVEAN